jgi:hypothetical protein
MKRLTSLLCAALAAALGGCSNSSDVTGNSTTVGNPAMVGTLVAESGTPVKGAEVKFYTLGHNPLADSLSENIVTTYTDANGRFVVDSMAGGMYTMVASNNSSAAFDDSIRVVEDSSNTLPPQTMRKPGTLRGRVQFDGGEDARTVRILVLGTHVWDAPADSNGRFTLEGLAAGTYWVRFLTGRDSYPTLDTNLSVVAGATTDLSGDIILPLNGLAAPKNLSATVDSALQKVHFNWDVEANPRIDHYTVYGVNAEGGRGEVVSGQQPPLIWEVGSAGPQGSFKLVAVDVHGKESAMGNAVSVTMGTHFSWSKIANASLGEGQHTMAFDTVSNQLYVLRWTEIAPMVFRYSLAGTLIDSTAVILSKKFTLWGFPSMYYDKQMVVRGGELFLDSPSFGILKIGVDGVATELSLDGLYVNGLALTPQGFVACTRKEEGTAARISYYDENGVLDGSKSVTAATSGMAVFEPNAITPEGESSFLVFHTNGQVSRLTAQGTMQPLFTIPPKYRPNSEPIGEIQYVAPDCIVHTDDDEMTVFDISGTLLYRLNQHGWGMRPAIWVSRDTFYFMNEGTLAKGTLKR